MFPMDIPFWTESKAVSHVMLPSRAYRKLVPQSQKRNKPKQKNYIVNSKPKYLHMNAKW